MQPIGIIHTMYEEAEGTPIQPTAARESLGSIVLRPELVSGLKDLDGFSHIILLYMFDRIKKSRLLVKPYMDDDEHGVFCYARPCPSQPNWLIGGTAA